MQFGGEKEKPQHQEVREHRGPGRRPKHLQDAERAENQDGMQQISSSKFPTTIDIKFDNQN